MDNCYYKSDIKLRLIAHELVLTDHFSLFLQISENISIDSPTNPNYTISYKRLLVLAPKINWNEIYTLIPTRLQIY